MVEKGTRERTGRNPPKNIQEGSGDTGGSGKPPTRDTGTTEEQPTFGIDFDKQVKEEVARQIDSDKVKKLIVGEIRKYSEDLKKKVNEELEEKVEKSRLRIIETLGIFVALFTFISVDIQIFKSPLRLLSAAGFTLILMGTLLWFLFYFHAFLHGLIKFRKTKKIEASILGSLRRVAVSVSGTTEEVKLSWYPKTWPNGVWLQVACGVLILGGLACIHRDYELYTPVYFDECYRNVEYVSEACLERLDKLEGEYLETSEGIVKRTEIGYLERLYNCLKKRRYWEYEQCFIE